MGSAQRVRVGMVAALEAQPAVDQVPAEDLIVVGRAELNHRAGDPCIESLLADRLAQLIYSNANESPIEVERSRKCGDSKPRK